MNIDHLREFTYLAETLSFAATARHFFISASVLSKHIASMEDDLQVKLFERDRRHVELTAAGMRFYTDIVPVIDGFDRAIANAAASDARAKLKVRVGYLRGAARPFLPRFVEYMEQSHPEIDLELTCMEYGELVRTLRAHRIDVALSLGFDPDDTGEYEFEKIYEDRFYVVVGKNHPFAQHKGTLLSADLAGQELILPDEQSYPGMAERFEAFVEGLDIAPGITRYKDVDTLFLQIARGSRIGFSSGHNASQFDRLGMFLPLQDVDMSYAIGAQWPKGTDERIVSVVRDASRTCAASMAAWSDGVAAGHRM